MFSWFFSSINNQTTYIDPRMALATKPKVKDKVKVDTFKTAMDILKDKNMSGKVVIITGTNSGIGIILMFVLSVCSFQSIISCFKLNLVVLHLY